MAQKNCIIQIMLICNTDVLKMNSKIIEEKDIHGIRLMGTWERKIQAYKPKHFSIYKNLDFLNIMRNTGKFRFIKQVRIMGTGERKIQA